MIVIDLDTHRLGVVMPGHPEPQGDFSRPDHAYRNHVGDDFLRVTRRGVTRRRPDFRGTVYAEWDLGDRPEAA